MEIIGKVKQICKERQGGTAAGPWCSLDVVVTIAGDNARDVALTFFGERKVERARNLKTGDMIQATATVRSKPSQDGERWFTSVDVASMVPLQRQQQTPLQEQ